MESSLEPAFEFVSSGFGTLVLTGDRGRELRGFVNERKVGDGAVNVVPPGGVGRPSEVVLGNGLIDGELMGDGITDGALEEEEDSPEIVMGGVGMIELLVVSVPDEEGVEGPDTLELLLGTPEGTAPDDELEEIEMEDESPGNVVTPVEEGPVEGVSETLGTDEETLDGTMGVKNEGTETEENL